MMARRSNLAVAALLALSIGCGGSPNDPGPINPPPGGGQQPPPNNQPVVESITLQGTGPRQPAGFADIGETIEVSASVRDDETAAGQLQFVWSAPVGTFSGTGARVTWQAPAQASTPMDVAIRLEVVERYGQTQQFEHRVSRSETLSLHDSVKEVGDMARQFLLDFSDSNIRDVAYVMRNFEPGCYGTADETQQVTDHRRDLRVTASTVGDATVAVNFGGICAFRSRPGDACANVPVFWASVRVSDGGRMPTVRGIDQIAAVYRSRQWRLCDSQFDGEVVGIMRRYIR